MLFSEGVTAVGDPRSVKLCLAKLSCRLVGVGVAKDKHLLAAVLFNQLGKLFYSTLLNVCFLYHCKMLFAAVTKCAIVGKKLRNGCFCHIHIIYLQINLLHYYIISTLFRQEAFILLSAENT